MAEAAEGPVLVLGAGGQLGRATLAALSRAGRPAFGLNRLQLDITDPVRVDEALAQVRPSVVINAAAYTAVDLAETDAETAFAVNGRAPGGIARAALRHGAAMIHLSTDYVFDGKKGAPYAEYDPVAPLSVYGESKLAGERAALEVGAPGLVLRTSWLLGSEGGFVAAILNRARSGEVLKVVEDQLGRPTLVEDLAQVLAALAQADRLPSVADVYHCGGSTDATWFDIASHLICAWVQKIERRPPLLRGIASSAWNAPARRPADSRLDSSRLEADFGLSGRDWRDGVLGLVEAWLNRISA